MRTHSAVSDVAGDQAKAEDTKRMRVIDAEKDELPETELEKVVGGAGDVSATTLGSGGGKC